MSPEKKEALRETARLMRAGTNFEEALGKGTRREGLDYSDYIDLASMVRDLAKKDGITLEAACRRMSRSDEEK